MGTCSPNWDITTTFVSLVDMSVQLDTLIQNHRAVKATIILVTSKWGHRIYGTLKWSFNVICVTNGSCDFTTATPTPYCTVLGYTKVPQPIVQASSKSCSITVSHISFLTTRLPIQIIQNSILFWHWLTLEFYSPSNKLVNQTSYSYHAKLPIYVLSGFPSQTSQSLQVPSQKAFP